MQGLNTYLETTAALIEAALVESLHDVSMSGCPEELLEVLRYSLLGGGKRVRPTLCLAACEAAGGKPAAAMPAALAIEVLHTYTLLHDDLPCMDNDDLRRGRPTVHKRFGYAEAVLAGDALQALAFELLSQLEMDSDLLVSVIRVFCRAAGACGVVGGQWVDVTAAPPHDLKRLTMVHQHKTADLIACAAQLGAMVAGANSKVVAALADFGNNLGLAFQIVDDLLDYGQMSETDEPGISCLAIWTLEEAQKQAAGYTEAAMAQLHKIPGDTRMLHAMAQHWLQRKY